MRHIVMILLVGVFDYASIRVMLQATEPWWKRA